MSEFKKCSRREFARSRFPRSPIKEDPGANGARVSRRMGEGLGAGGTPPGAVTTTFGHLEEFPHVACRKTGVAAGRIVPNVEKLFRSSRHVFRHVEKTVKPR